jgi:nucleoside-diphosphate-sugar epimerase
MRIFVCGDELGLGFVIARRLVAEGHQVNILTASEDLIPNLTKNGLKPVLVPSWENRDLLRVLRLGALHCGRPRRRRRS